MRKRVKNIVLYPDLQLDFADSKCVINCKYHSFTKPDYTEDEVTVEKYVPQNITSIAELFDLLKFLDEKSGNQKVSISKGKKRNYLMMSILGLPACIIPPLGLYMLTKGILGLLGQIKETYTFPKISISSNYFSEEAENLLDSFNRCFEEKNLNAYLFDSIFSDGFKTQTSNCDKEIIDKSDCIGRYHFYNLEVDDGARILLKLFHFSECTYDTLEDYSTRWEHENKDGSPDARYKNNPSYKEITGYALTIQLLRQWNCSYYFHNKYEFNDCINALKQIKKLALITQLQLVRDITPLTRKLEISNITNVEIIQQHEINSLSQKKRLWTFILCFFLGFFGMHRIYTRKIKTGTIQLLVPVFTILLLGITQWDVFAIPLICSIIWYLVDLFFILAGKFKDKEDRYIKKWF